MSSLFFERTYNAPIAKVWKAITDKNQMKEWYFALDEFRPEPGFEFSFYGEKDGRKYLHKCQVVTAEPVHKLAYTWRYDGYPGSSLVTFDLQELPGTKTKLTLTHSGLDSFPQDEPDFSPQNFSQGWTFITGTSLAEFVETDVIRNNITIKATAEKVWEVLLEPNNKWATAFGEGAIAQTDWKEGSPVIWTDLNGAVGARGVIRERQDNQKLLMQYYDETESTPGETPGDYIESFFIDSKEGKTVELRAESGPLAKKYLKTHGEMWQRAMELIKSLSEK